MATKSTSIRATHRRGVADLPIAATSSDAGLRSDRLRAVSFSPWLPVLPATEEATNRGDLNASLPKGREENMPT